MKPETDIRKRAEALLKDQKLIGIDQYSESDLLKIVHELEVHQIELEMLNDELLIAHEQSIKKLDDRYAELYNLEPTGYFTLSQEGAILELNLSGAQMLGKEQLHLIGSRFGFFILENTKLIFNNFLDDVFTGTGTKECEVILDGSNDVPKYVQLTGIKSCHAGGQCLITMADITGQKEVQAKIQRSEIFLKAAQMIAGLGTFSLDLVKRTWESSEVLDLIFGVDTDFDKSFEGLISIVHPDWQQLMRDYFDRLVAEKDVIFEIENKIVRRIDHAERWIHVIGQIEFDAQKQPVALMGGLVDITEHKLIEVKLKESEKYYHSLISNLHIGVLVQNPLSEILMSNNRALELLGLNEDQLLEKNTYDADWNVIHEDGTPYPGPMRPALQCIATHEPVRDAVMGVYRPVTRDRVWLLVNADPELNPDGSIKEVISTFKDITERKNAEKALQESEQRFRTVVEFSSNSIVVHRDGKIVFVNPAAIKMFGATAASDLLGMPILNRIHPDYHEIILSRVQKAIGSLIEVKYLRLDGTIIDAEVKGALIVYDGEAAIQASIYDITERKLAEEKITLKSEELQRVNAEKDKFFSIIAHDLRSPFNGFLGLTQLLSEELSGMTAVEIRQAA